MKKAIRLTVNGAAVSAYVEPRLQLADFLREHLSLTGTHLGCEHGVCGACTVEIDGAPARSCIAYAVACDGADVRTIEGYDGDAVMAELREAFSAEHALQCGYCTPGMLVTARDIVLRLPQADEARIRKELAGNLCRCTGYVGIVRAIRSVIAKQPGASLERVAPRPLRLPASPVAAAVRSEVGAGTQQRVHTNDLPSLHAGKPRGSGAVAQEKADGGFPMTQGAASGSAASDTAKAKATLHQSFIVDHPREKVWDFFGRLGEVTTCLPGASVLGTPTDDHIELKLRVKLGPIAPEFAGAADVVREPSDYSGTIRGSARDARLGSTTRGEIRYVLADEKGGAATRVDIDVFYTLTGALAQFSRSGIVQDIARRMSAAFAQNLEARLNQRDGEARTGRSVESRTNTLDAGSLFLSALWNRIKAFFRSSP